MAKTGRKAKSGERYPSGKLKPAPREVGPPPAQIKRMFDMAEAKACDPTLSTSVGWLRLHGKITTLQVSAAVSYATTRGRFHRAMGFKPRTAASPSYEIGYGSSGGPEDEERILRARGTHFKLVQMFSPAETQFMDRICIDDEMPGSWEVQRLVTNLDRVVKAFRLTH